MFYEIFAAKTKKADSQKKLTIMLKNRQERESEYSIEL